MININKSNRSIILNISPIGLEFDRNESFISLKNQNISSDSISNYHNWYVLPLISFAIFGIFGNILVCMTIKRDHSLQTKTNYYLFSLALADLAVCIIVLPLSIVQDFYGNFNIVIFILLV
jgi:hypothetical protein